MVTDLIGPLLRDYVDRAQQALTDEGRPAGRVVRHGPGARLPWDECCDGQLWARVVNVQPVVTQQARGISTPCGVMFWQVTVGLNIIRCVATVNDAGQAPPADVIEEDGQLMLDDLATLQQVILCHPDTRSILSWTPLGAQGGCAGGEWQFTARMGVCGCESQPWPVLPSGNPEAFGAAPGGP